jgi:anthranilate phosphoribosyltransferase
VTALECSLQHLAGGGELSADGAADAFAEIMAGTAPEARIAAFLTALRIRGETAATLAGAVRAIRAHMVPFEAPAPGLLDTCGTGGDGAATINISTATALVCASCGVPVAKHGNRSASGNSGSAEVLAELGVAIEPENEVLECCLAELGITFLFAPRFHPALRSVAAVRKQLPFRTLFNLVGPLVNPARPAYQLIGIPDPRLADLLAATVSGLGVRRAAVVTGADRLDEVSLSGANRVLWVDDGRIEQRTWTPGDFGLGEVRIDDLRVTGPAESARKLRRMLEGEPGPIRAVVLANTAAALLVAGAVTGLRAGVDAAASGLDSGRAAELLDRWSRLSNS